MKKVLMVVTAAALIVAGNAGAVYEYAGKWGSSGRGDGQFTFPRGVALAPNGNVYVADTQNHRMQYFTATGSFLGKWGSGGSGEGQFNYPQCVAVAPDGKVYVADFFNNRIQYFTSTGSFLGKCGNGKFSWPWDVAISPDGRRVYVTDDCRVQYFRWSDPDVAHASLGRVKALFE